LLGEFFSQVILAVLSSFTRQAAYGVDMYLFQLLNFPVEMFWLSLHLMPVVALHTSNAFSQIKSSVL
jgi:hypothetical protein